MARASLAKLVQTKIVPIIAVLGALVWSAHIVLAVFVTKYFQALRDKKCPCAVSPRGTFLYVGSLVQIGLIPLVFGLNVWAMLKPQPRLQAVRQVLSLGFTGFVIAFLVYTRRYLREIEQDRCKCGKEDARWKLLRGWFYLWLAQLGLGVLLLILSVAFLVYLLRRA